STGTRLASDSPSPATVFKHTPPDVAHITPNPPPTAAITISHRRCGILMLSQDRGEIRTEIRSIIKIFDIGTIHAEDVIHADRRKVLDNVVNHPVSPGYGVHAVTVDGTCLDIAAMVPNTRWAITPYVEPPS